MPSLGFSQNHRLTTPCSGSSICRCKRPAPNVDFYFDEMATTVGIAWVHAISMGKIYDTLSTRFSFR